jgi:hypothetical protein
MSQVSRPMQVVLLVTVAFAAVWFVALRPKPSSAGGAPATSAQTTPAAPGVAGLKSAIDQAHGAVATADGDAQRAARSSADGSAAPASGGAAPAGGSGTSAPASGSAPARGSAPAAAGGAPASAPATTHARSQVPRAAHPAHHRRARQPEANGTVASVRAALRARKAVALAFVDDSTADSQAVARELLHVSRFHGRALVLSVPLADLSEFDFITNDVQVTVAPTVVIVDRRLHATTIVGFADAGEIEQRIADALAVKPAR